jgi:hypothetical protein
MVHDPVTITVTHPPFPDSGIEVERWTTRLGWEEFNLTGFSFDVPGELVLGTWTFEAHVGGRELFRVSSRSFRRIWPRRCWPSVPDGLHVLTLAVSP